MAQVLPNTTHNFKLNYPHMFLLELKGESEQKMAVSGSIKFQALKSRIHTTPNSTKSCYFIIRKGLRAKVISMAATVREVHDRFSDTDGYLRIYVREEAAF